MVYLQTSDAWLAQSALLLKAYPNSTRITTKYSVPDPSKVSKKAHKTKTPTTDATAAASAPAGPQAYLTLKTYDPQSGTTLKYRTDKAFEVGRLVTALHKLSRAQAGLPELKESEDVVMGEAGTATPAEEDGPAVSVPAPAAGGGGKKKKKGRK